MAKIGKNLSLNGKQMLFILIFIGLVSITLLSKLHGNSNKDPVKNDYQAELNGIVTPDFTLVSSTSESGLDVGTMLTDDYTTRLTYDQAISVMESNASKKGYPTPVNAQCLGGIEYQSNRGSLEICETKTRDKKGVSTFEISLNNFNNNPSKITPTFQCVGDCKN